MEIVELKCVKDVILIDRAPYNFLYATTRQLLVSQDNMGACYVLMGRDVIKKQGG